MRKAAFLLAFVPALASAGNWYGASSGALIEEAAQTAYTFAANEHSIEDQAPGSGQAVSNPLTGTFRLTGPVTMRVDVTNTSATAKTFSMTFSYYDGGGGLHTLCSASQSISSANDGVLDFTCTAPVMDLVPGMKLAIFGTAPENGLASCSIRTPILMISTACATAGSPGACYGICNGATCGTQYTTGIDSNRCGVDCATCSALSLPAPAGFACTDQANGADVSCGWNATAGASSYFLSRDGSQIYTGAAQGFLDTTGSGEHSYSIYASGSCTPGGQGSTLATKITPTSTSSTAVRSKGIVSGCW